MRKFSALEKIIYLLFTRSLYAKADHSCASSTLNVKLRAGYESIDVCFGSRSGGPCIEMWKSGLHWEDIVPFAFTVPLTNSREFPHLCQ